MDAVDTQDHQCILRAEQTPGHPFMSRLVLSVRPLHVADPMPAWQFMQPLLLMFDPTDFHTVLALSTILSLMLVSIICFNHACPGALRLLLRKHSIEGGHRPSQLSNTMLQVTLSLVYRHGGSS